MLTKIENAYLNILRVVVLVAATLALLGAALGLVRSVPLLVDLVNPKASATSVPGATLGDFVAQKQLAGVSPGSAPAGAATSDDVPSGIKKAVQSLAHYDKTRLGSVLDSAGATRVFVNFRGEMPSDVQDGYADSTAALMAQLDSSRGTPLSIDMLNELIEWHATKFKEAAVAHEATKAEETTTATQSLLVAAIGFGVFIAIIFCFIVVKIERNLRLVRTFPTGDL